ncbi:hypothetical protein Tdes44962_MAKER07054 [Teratosphaeria destructans]|uniref:Uncharacterized protein n=1 Tax=Teratosphaeria destructans TaxID=418781 RepID=A0A9W7SZX2_9PEZI|nr:hypothetical protein Tdes44962_MAKER07054 [Teratosphaeria destructans]
MPAPPRPARVRCWSACRIARMRTSSSVHTRASPPADAFDQGDVAACDTGLEAAGVPLPRTSLAPIVES